MGDVAEIRSSGPNRRRWLVAAAVVAILIGAAAARFLDLQSNPGGLYLDEAAEALSGREILRNPGYRPVFLVEDGGREALYAYTVAAGFAVGGDSVVTLRAVAALWGVLGVLGLWLLGRRFGVGAGLAAAAWAAGALWLIVISRDGMRNTITPVFCAVAMLSLLVWNDRPSRRTAILAGAAMAIGSLYTYHALRLLPLLAVIWGLWLRRVDRPAYRRLLATSPAFLVAFAVVGAPMAAFAISDPQAYLGRAIGVSPFNPNLVPETGLVTHTLRTFGMFAFVGDPNPRHDVAALPMLSLPFVGLAVVGLITLWRRRNEAASALILLSLPVFLLPPLVATEGAAPHFLRALGLAVPVAMTIGVGAQAVARRLTQLISASRSLPARRRPPPRTASNLSVGAFGLLFLVLGLSSLSTYLSRPVADRYAAFTYDVVAMAELARTSSDAVIVDDFDAFTVRYLRDGSLPTLMRPGVSLGARTVDRVFARTRQELVAAVGSELAATAVAVAWDPAGQPTVWAVTLT